jgi:hypothetical protein
MPDYSKLSREEVEDYGEPFLDVVQRASASAPEVRTLQQEVHNLKQQLQQEQHNRLADSRERMKAELDRDIPWWHEINERPEFLAALSRKDENTGYTYHDWLKKHRMRITHS